MNQSLILTLRAKFRVYKHYSSRENLHRGGRKLAKLINSKQALKFLKPIVIV